MGCGSSTTPGGLPEEEVTVGHQGSVQARTCEIEQTKSQPAGASQRSYSLMLSHALSLMLSRPFSLSQPLTRSHPLSQPLALSSFVLRCAPPSKKPCNPLSQSSAHNHGTIETGFFGPYANLRRGLDYEYHTNYLPERQKVQDLSESELERDRRAGLRGRVVARVPQRQSHSG